MFYVMNNENLSIFNDSKEIIETTLKFMPQLKGQYIIETDIVNATELEQNPNKVIVGDVEIEIDVPDYEIVTEEYAEVTQEPLLDIDGNPVLDENNEPIISTTTEMKPHEVQKPIIVEVDGEEVQSTHKETIIVKGLVLNPNYEEEKAQKERERINNLKCTKRVFALMLQELGIPYAQLKALISTSEQAQLEWELCVELQRGNPLIDVFGEQLGIQHEQIDLLFKVANGESPVEELRETVNAESEEQA